MSVYFGWGFFAVGSVLLVTSIYLLVLSLGYRKSKRMKTTAWLTKAKHLKRLYTRRGLVKDAVEARYEYFVAGKMYHLEPLILHAKPHNLPRHTTVFYQKNHPFRAFLDLSPLPLEPILCFVTFFLSCIFLGNGILFWNV